VHDFQDCAGELVDLVLGVCGGEFIDPEDGTMGGVERGDEGLFVSGVKIKGGGLGLLGRFV